MSFSQNIYWKSGSLLLAQILSITGAFRLHLGIMQISVKIMMRAYDETTYHPLRPYNIINKTLQRECTVWAAVYLILMKRLAERKNEVTFSTMHLTTDNQHDGHPIALFSKHLLSLISSSTVRTPRAVSTSTLIVAVSLLC